MIEAQDRVFTNREGKKVTGTVKTVSNGIVQIEIGGKIFEVPFQSLSDEDQVYLREWVANNYPYKFDLRESDHRENLDGSPGKPPGCSLAGGGKYVSPRRMLPSNTRSMKHYQGHFKLVLSNRSGIPANNLKVKYQIVSVQRYTTRGDRGGKDEEVTMVQTGEIDIAQIAHTRSVTLQTDSVYLPDSKWETTSVIRYTDGTSDNKPTDHRSRCDLHGIMVRVYDENDRELFSYVGPGKHMEDQKWQ